MSIFRRWATTPASSVWVDVERTVGGLPAGEDRRLAARFLALLAAGERVAQQVAVHQARLAPTAREARFFRSQAEQERLHAFVFERACRALDPSSGDMRATYRRFLERIDAAAHAGRYLECILATQVILESVGELLLGELDAALTRRGAGFQRLRRLFLAQEAAHHAFGHALMSAALANGLWTEEDMTSCARPYLGEVSSWLTHESELSRAFGFDHERLLERVASEVTELAAGGMR